MAAPAIETPETLIEEFNEGLKAIREDGRYDEIVDRFGVEGS